MDFAASGSFNGGVKAISVGSVNSMRLSNVKYEEIDFSATVDEVADVVSPYWKWTVESLHWYMMKGKESKAFSGIVTSLLKGHFSEKALGVIGDASVSGAFAVGVLKLVSSAAVGKVDSFGAGMAEFAKGFVKESASKYVGQNVVQARIVHNLMSLLEKSGRISGTLSVETLTKIIGDSKLNEKSLFNEMSISTMVGNLATSIGVGIVIDYGASVVSNFVATLVDGEKFDVSQLKLGSSLLKSTYKTVFASVGLMIGGVLGAPKLGSNIGSVIGATVGDFAINLFDKNEEWCAKAGAASIIGSFTGLGIGLALVSLLNPVTLAAAVIVGVATISATLVATWFTKLAYDATTAENST